SAELKRNYSDAPLRAICFVDRNEGWAAGDDGVVWHTIDGGNSWDRQKTGVTGSLRAIHFLNPFTGWIVGREELPNGGGSTGVILHTSDGGLKWTRLAINVLPGQHAVKFFDDRTGIVAGEGADAFGSGVFETIDGGRSWRPIPGPRQPGWLTADFTDPRTGATAGAWSSLAILRDSVFGKSDIDTLGGRSILGLRIYGQHAAAVGQGGLLLISRDSAGTRWSYATPKCLSRESLSNCDFNAVCVLGEQIWVTGRPGSIVLHSADYGKTWECFHTGQNLPLHAIYFTDIKTGWAVGEFGTILGTEDGGRTWRIQQCAGERSAHRAAVVFLHASPETLPLEALASLGGDEGYLAAAVRVTAADPTAAPLKRAADPQRWAEAVRRAGGAAGECLWQFPLAQYQANLPAKELMAAWDKLHDGHAAEMLLRQLVLSLRIWQPDVVVTDPSGSDDSLVDVAVREAFVRAADPNAFPEQLEQLGLKPCTAKKLYGLAANGVKLPEQVVMDGTLPLRRCGDTPRDIAAEAFGLLLDNPVTMPNSRVFHLRESRLSDAGHHTHLMQGIVLANGGPARREFPALTETDLAGIEERVKGGQARRNMEALANPNFAALGGAERVIGQLGAMLKSLPVDHAAAGAFALASGYARSGQWDLAREAFILLVDRYPSAPQALDAYRWLARYASSSEARRRYEMGQFQIVTHADFSITPGKGSE
ncbi:MAG TPA: YCF48-related protein, partial [Acidocella sp.]|nr:YCF48-related protein [Acidocella sp.]